MVKELREQENKPLRKCGRCGCSIAEEDTVCDCEDLFGDSL